MFDEYIREEVFPFIYASCQTDGHPDRHDGRVARGVSRREHALPLSAPGQALLRALRRLRPEALHGRAVRRQLLLPQPGGLPGEPRAIRGSSSSSRAARSASSPARARGKRAASRTRCQASSRRRASATHLDDWGPRGGHDWPYWKDQMREYFCGATGDGTRSGREQLSCVQRSRSNFSSRYCPRSIT